MLWTRYRFHGRKIFVCGGDDFKLYKYNYETGVEIGKNVKNDFKKFENKRFKKDIQRLIKS